DSTKGLLEATAFEFRERGLQLGFRRRQKLLWAHGDEPGDCNGHEVIEPLFGRHLRDDGHQFSGSSGRPYRGIVDGGYAVARVRNLALTCLVRRIADGFAVVLRPGRCRRRRLVWRSPRARLLGLATLVQARTVVLGVALVRRL